MLAVRDEDVARRSPQQVFGVAPDVHVVIAVDADATNDQQPGRFFPNVLNDFFKGFAVQQGGLDVRVLGLRQFPGDIQVRLVDLG